MKNIIHYLAIIAVYCLCSSCATICGGSRYYAHVVVSDKPAAKIFYQGELVGKGNARILLKRAQADKLAVTVKQEGCPDQTFNFVTRSLRGWAFFGSLLTFTGVTNDDVPIPYGIAIDFITGAIWKPNESEHIIKEDFKNFKYILNYNTCPDNPATVNKNIDVIYLKNGSIIKGTIIEQIPAVQIKIQTKDGSSYVYKVEDIEKITKE